MKYKNKYAFSYNGIIYKFLKKMYLKNKVTRYLVNIYIQKYEGGQFYSQTIRRIFREKYDIDVGIGTYGCFTTNFRPHVKIGNYCSIAPGVQRLVGNHPMTDISTHPLFHLKEFGCCEETKYESHKLTIGNDVWIGVNAIITGNVEYIGDGAVIGAGAVVTHNVEPYAVVAGCPAKIIRFRFTKEEQDSLTSSKWFELTPNEIQPAVKYADNIGKFVEEVQKIRRNINK